MGGRSGSREDELYPIGSDLLIFYSAGTLLSVPVFSSLIPSTAYRALVESSAYATPTARFRPRNREGRGSWANRAHPERNKKFASVYMSSHQCWASIALTRTRWLSPEVGVRDLDDFRIRQLCEGVCPELHNLARIVSVSA